MGIFDYIDEEEFDFWQKQRKADRWAQDDAASQRYAQPGPFDDGFQQAQRMEPLRTLQPAPMPVPEPEPVAQPSPEWNQGSRSYGQPGPFDVPQERVRRSVEPEPPQPPQPTGDILGNAFRAAQRQPKRDLLTEIGDIARGLGHDDDAARVAQAIARTEGALEGQVGDTTLPGGGSHGPFQFYGKYGMLPAYAKSLGVSEDQAAEYARANPQHAARWALQGYLGQAIKEGQAKGLKGADLATYAQTYGQRSQSPERAGQNYQAMFGGRVSPVMQGQAQQEPLRTLRRPAEERMPERDPLKEFGDYAGGLVDNITKGVSGLFDRRPEAPQAAGPKKPDFLTSFAQDQARIAREAREARAARGEMLPYERRLPTQEEGPRPIDQIGADLGGALTGTLQASMPALEAAFNAAEWLDMTFLRGLLKAGAQLNPTDPRFRASWLDRQEYERMTKPMLEGGFTAAVTRLIPEGAPRKVAARIGEGLSGGFHAAQLEDIRQKQRLPEEEYTTWRAEQDQKAAKEWERWATEEENPLVGMVASIVNPIGWVVGPVEAVQAGKMLYSAAKGSRAVQTAGRGLKRAGQVFMEGAKDTPIGLTVEDVGKVPLATQPAPTFYSQLERTLADAKQPKWRPGDLRGYLRATGVKDEELKWTGFDDYLQERANAKQSVTRDEALQFVKDNQVEVKEVVKGGQSQEDLSRHLWELNRRDAVGETLTDAERAERSRLNQQIASGQQTIDNTKFSRQQLPGGENYRELLLTLPEKPVDDSALRAYQAELRAKYGSDANIVDKATPAELDRLDQLGAGTRGVQYTSPHFDEPNVLAHVRFNDRLDASGKKVLFVEEVQSDWHQAGRSKGYQTKNIVTDLPEGYSVKPVAGRFVAVTSDDIPVIYGFDALADTPEQARTLALAYLNESALASGVPAAPFSKTWPELAMKRVIRWAADNGYDRVAWTTGEQQAKRYDLSKQLDALRYIKRSDGSYVLYGRKGESSIIEIPQDGGSIPANKLEDYVGKDVAKRIIEGVGEPVPNSTTARELSGLNLSVGGEGMKGFYDQILPEVMNKLGKKFGARVGETRIGTTKPKYQVIATGLNEVYDSEDEARRAADWFGRTYDIDKPEVVIVSGGKETVHSLDITPSMREAVITKGQPLFMAPEATGGVLGGIYGLATDDPNLSDRERVSEFLQKTAGGGLAARVVTKGMKSITPGLTVEDITKGKVSIKTGLTKGQEQFLADRLKDVAPVLPDQTLTGKAGKAGQTIAIPGDGEVTVYSKEQASNLHYNLTDKPLEGLAKPRAKISSGASTKHTWGTPSVEDEADRMMQLYGHPTRAAEVMERQLEWLGRQPLEVQVAVEHSRAGQVINLLKERATGTIRGSREIPGTGRWIADNKPYDVEKELARLGDEMRAPVANRGALGALPEAETMGPTELERIVELKKAAATDIKADKWRGVYAGTFEGQAAWSDGTMIQVGEPPSKFRVSDGKPDFDQVKNGISGTIEPQMARPYGVAYFGDYQAVPFVVLQAVDGTVHAIPTGQYGSFTRKFKDAEFLVRDNNNPIEVRSKGKLVGLIMPLKLDEANLATVIEKYPELVSRSATEVPVASTTADIINQNTGVIPTASPASEVLPARREAAPSVEDVGKAPTAYVQARKQAGTGKYELFYRGTRNKVELTEGELFDSPRQATATYEARWYKDRQAAPTEAPPAAQAATPEPPAIKQPWEMTKGEWDTAVNPIRQARDAGNWQDVSGIEAAQQQFKDQFGYWPDNLNHRGLVEGALRENKPVPDAVLKDYPDLVKQYGKPTPIGSSYVPTEEPKPAYDGFLDAMTPMARTRAEQALDTSVMNNGKPISRKALVDQKIEQGATVEVAKNGERRLTTPDGAFLSEKQISKTAMDYAEYRLVKAAPAPELKPPLTEPAPIKEKTVRFEAGKTLKPEERKEVIRSVVDVYRAKGAPKVTKGFDRNGDEIIGFEYSPDLFERSDITGKMVRYYIKLPDGRIAHPSELYPELTEAKIARAIEEEQASIKRAAKDAAYLQARRDARIVDAASGENQRTQANQKYAQTGRLRPYSYLAQDENGGIVRVDGMSQKDIDYYTSKGFVPITEPAKPDASDMGRFSRARQVIEANIEDVPPNVLADYPDLAAKTAPTTTEPLPADISKATAETLTEEATPPPIASVDDAALTPEGAQPAEVRPRRPTMAERYEQWKATQPPGPAPAATAGAPPPLEPPQGPPPTLPSGRQPGGPQNRRPYTPPDPYQQLQDALKPETQSLGQQLGEGFNAFMRAMYDRNYDLGALEKATGIPVHKLAQVVSGAVAAGEDRVRRFVLPIVEPLGKDVRHLEEYMVLMRNGDILARNPSAQLPGGIPGWPGVIEAEKRLQSRIGPERFAAVKAAAEQMWKVNDDWILKPLVDNGMLSTDSYRAIKSAHPHYIDFHRADFSLTDTVERGLARPEANVSNLGIKQMELAGSQRKLDQPLARTEAQIIRTRVLISRNRAARGIVEALQALEKEAPEVQRRVRLLSSKEAAEHSNVTDTISFFKEGQKVVYQVPPQFASIAKHVEAETVGAWWNLASQVLGASVLRKGAVQYNPLFLIVNPMRDAVGAFFREGLVPMSPDYIRGWVAAITQNSDFTDAAEAGVLMSGIVDTMRSTEAMSRARNVGRIQLQSWGDALKLVPRLIERANIVGEQATRIATYFKLRGQGIAELEDAIRARDVSVDFAKSGNVMKLINQMIPFSNAGLQGASNTVRLFKDNPKQALLASSLLAMPSIAAYTWNQRYESSKKIPEYEYINFWVLQVGEGMKNVDPKYPDQPAEKFPIYIRIPKGPTGAFLTTPVEIALRLAEAKGDASVQDQLLKGAWSMARSLSPIEPNLSGIVPPVGGMAIGLSTGQDLFRGQEIVPRREESRPAELQYGSETSDVAVALGERFQMSPRMIEWAIKDVGAGVASQTMWVSDLVLNSLGYNPKAPGELKRQALTETEAISRNPIAGRFVGTRDTAEESANWDRFNKLVEDTNRAYASIPEVRRFGLTMGPVSESVSIDGKAQPYSWPERIKLQQDTFDTRKTGIDALTRSSLYAKADDAEKLELIQDVARKANEWAKANRPAAEMREYPTALEQRRQYKEIEPSVTGMTPEQLRLSGAFLRMKNDIAQTLPPLNNRSEFALRMAAERDPKGFEQYRLRMYIEKKIGKQLTMMKQDFWAKHPLLQKFFSDTPAQVPVKAAS